MTTLELIDALSSVELQDLSDDDLKKMRAMLSLKLSEADWTLQARLHHRIHHSLGKDQTT